MKQKLILVVACIICLIVYPVIAALYKEWSIQASGKVKAIGLKVYQDANLTLELTQIDWGLLEPGGKYSVLCFVKSTGVSNIPSTLRMVTANWSSSLAQSYISLEWNRQEYVLAAGEVIDATLVLSVHASIQGVSDFKFDIIISASG